MCRQKSFSLKERFLKEHTSLVVKNERRILLNLYFRKFRVCRDLTIEMLKERNSLRGETKNEEENLTARSIRLIVVLLTQLAAATSGSWWDCFFY